MSVQYAVRFRIEVLSEDLYSTSNRRSYRGDESKDSFCKDYAFIFEQ